jgi:hypothetical protein
MAAPCCSCTDRIHRPRRTYSPDWPEVGMSRLPHDASDLFLAPVALALDQRIHELGQLGPKALSDEIALESDLADWTRELREEALLRTIGHLIDNHEWRLSWDVRGLRLSHQDRYLVLGIPDSFRAFLAGGVEGLLGAT